MARSYDAATAAYLSASDGIIARQLMWIRAKRRDTGQTEVMGLWSGEQAQLFSIDSKIRLYHGAGAMPGLEALTYTAGLQVQMHEILLNPLHPQVTEAIRLYDARWAPVEIHRAFFHVGTRKLVSEPHRVWKGWIETMSLPRPAPGGTVEGKITLAGASRALTRGIPLKKSDESQRRRQGCRFYRYSSVSGDVPIYWGEAEAQSNKGGIIDSLPFGTDPFDRGLDL